ncbi:hypothetical protein ACMU_07725 [Actibacterium mucosum KCTC 23349]|uniref:Calcium-binding protein n=1 Tax=Actibacterium mucosum KCTC 23349 TaxID=1454373 RepID=A0A037ZL52_9RHOB|nr:calcium-binding protein [Actibacterium mucosum]KAJ56819.1 hypothetical protein ACMU_07725 [Actibacterium mucosum KCTC 23349]
MSDTAGLNIINLQVRADEVLDYDKGQPGTLIDPETGELFRRMSDQNKATDKKYYLWHSEFQTLPMGLGNFDRHAQNYAEGLKATLGQTEINTLRLPFNEYSFDETGALHSRYETFLREVTVGDGQFDVIFGYFGGDAQRFGGGYDPDKTAQQIFDALEGPIYNGISDGWTLLLNWLDHPENAAVREAVVGAEIVNEPATYLRAGVRSETQEGEDAALVLYAQHMVALGQMIDARIDTPILVGGYAFSAQFKPFAEVMVDDRSVLNYIRDGLGEDLIWSSHFYPKWQGGKQARRVEDMHAVFEDVYGVLEDDNILVTETNVQGIGAINWSGVDQNQALFAEAMDWFTDNGIGIAWFPGAQTGASHLMSYNNDGAPTISHPPSLAIALNVYSADEAPQAHAGDQQVDAWQLALRNMRNEDLSIDANGDGFAESRGGDRVYEADGTMAGFAFGYGGADNVRGAESIDFLYGGTGADRVEGAGAGDFLFGQAGDDVLLGQAGPDKLFGGPGDDLLSGGTGANQLHGGNGADLFQIATGGQDVITDFDASEGDRVEINGDAMTLAQIASVAQVVDADIEGHGNDLLLEVAGARVLILDSHQSAVETVYAGDGDDLLEPAGGTSAYGDQVRAGAGDDKVLSGDGPDVVFGQAGNDWLEGGGDDDILSGGAGDDRIEGEGDDDVILGGDGKDSLRGGAGNDVLIDGPGLDDMEGGIGADVFVVTVGDGERDRIKDFRPSDGDLIDLGHWGAMPDLQPFTKKSVEVPGTWLVTLGNEALMVEVKGQGQNEPRPLEPRDFTFAATDYVLGTDDSERLSGGSGADGMLGLAAADLFVVGPADTVLDFEAGLDRIDVSGMASSFDQLVIVGKDGAFTIRAGAQSFAVTLHPTNLQAELSAIDFVF